MALASIAETAGVHSRLGGARRAWALGLANPPPVYPKEVTMADTPDIHPSAADKPFWERSNHQESPPEGAGTAPGTAVEGAPALEVERHSTTNRPQGRP